MKTPDDRLAVGSAKVPRGGSRIVQYPRRRFLVQAGLAGVGFGCVQVLPWAIIPDVVEFDEYQSGQRHEGMFYSLVTLFRKVASSVAIPLTLVILGRVGYIANAPVQSPSALRGIMIMIALVPAVMFFIGAYFARRLPITRESFARVRAELERRRAGENEPILNR